MIISIINNNNNRKKWREEKKSRRESGVSNFNEHENKILKMENKQGQTTKLKI